jgi:hypothetical protein
MVPRAGMGLARRQVRRRSEVSHSHVTRTRGLDSRTCGASRLCYVPPSACLTDLAMHKPPVTARPGGRGVCDAARLSAPQHGGGRHSPAVRYGTGRPQGGSPQPEKASGDSGDGSPAGALPQECAGRRDNRDGNT